MPITDYVLLQAQGGGINVVQYPKDGVEIRWRIAQMPLGATTYTSGWNLQGTPEGEAFLFYGTAAYGNETSDNITGLETSVKSDIQAAIKALHLESHFAGVELYATGSDLLIGWGGDDTLNGLSGNDVLAGDVYSFFPEVLKIVGNDKLFGGAGDDFLIGGSGNDSIDGGSEDDTAVYVGNYANYKIEKVTHGLKITDLRGETYDGTDTLTDVEFLQFRDKKIQAGLFTWGNDKVDFNKLRTDQKAEIQLSGISYDALGGNDVVILPNQQLTPDFDHTTAFRGGSGNDTITGSIYKDTIFGDDGDDTLLGSVGEGDALFGGAGADNFDFSAQVGLAGFANGTTQSLDGGAENPGTQDVIKLPGSANDYSFQVTFGSGWADTRTAITSLNGSGLVKVTFDTSQIEHARFASPVDNHVTPTGKSLTVEMALLAQEVYGDVFDGFHKKEPLLSDKPGLPRSTDPISAAAVQDRHWHAVSALELGMLPGDFHSPGKTNSDAGVDWSFVGGHYAAYAPSFIGVNSVYQSDVPEANALVLSGEFNGDKLLTVVLRGTDQFADFDTFTNFDKYYGLFKPLVNGLRTYVAENAPNRILIAGHSLGAGALQYLLSEDFLKGNSQVSAWTFGSPGSEVVSGNANVYNFVHTDDLITKVPGIIDGAHLLGLAGLLTGDPVAAAIGVIGGAFSSKHRTGNDVRINSDVAGVPTLAEHSQALYFQDVLRLNEFANDSDSPFKNSALGIAISQGTTYQGGDVQVGVGRQATEAPAQIINASRGDNYVLAHNGFNDDINVSTLDLIADTTRIFDGGTGSKGPVQQDLIILPIVESLARKTANGLGWDLTMSGAIGPLLIGTIYRIELIVYRDKCVRSDDSAVNIQTPGNNAFEISPVGGGMEAASGLLTFQLAAGFDGADAGDGSMRVVGTSGDDLLYIGAGSKSISLGKGRDIVMTRDATMVGALTMSLGDGNDLAYAASGADRIDGGTGFDELYGGGGDDWLSGGSGADTLLGQAGNDTYIVDSVEDVVIENVGEGTDTVLAKVSYALAPGQEIETLQTDPSTKGSNLELSGNEFSNTLIGNDGNNLLDGRGGADRMAGRGGNDIYVVDDLGDSVTEKPGEGTDLVRSAVEYQLTAFVENLTLTGSADIDGAGNSLANSLVGNLGDNVLDGAGGADVLTGLAGKDTFVLGGILGGMNIDTVADFDVADDTIELRYSKFASLLGTGALSPTKFVANAGGLAQDGDDRIIYDSLSGKLFFDSNGSGSGGVTQFALLSSGLSLSSSNFVVT